MEKIILRRDVLDLRHSNVGSNLIFLGGGRNCSSAEKLIQKFGFKKIMKELYNEDVDGDELFQTSLYKSYMELQDTRTQPKQNEQFIAAYRIDSDIALYLDEHINLYRLSAPNEYYSKIVPWRYAVNKLYLGDRWDEEDESILENIQKLNVVEFLKLYKGI